MIYCFCDMRLLWSISQLCVSYIHVLLCLHLLFHLWLNVCMMLEPHLLHVHVHVPFRPLHSSICTCKAFHKRDEARILHVVCDCSFTQIQVYNSCNSFLARLGLNRWRRTLKQFHCVDVLQSDWLLCQASQSVSFDAAARFNELFVHCSFCSLFIH